MGFSYKGNGLIRVAGRTAVGTPLGLGFGSGLGFGLGLGLGLRLGLRFVLRSGSNRDDLDPSTHRPNPHPLRP